MYTTPEARPITEAEAERMQQVERAWRWHKTGRSWVDFSGFAAWGERYEQKHGIAGKESTE